MANQLIPLETPLERIPFTVVDTETTGLSPAKGHRICEVGVKRGVPGAKEDGDIQEFSTLIDPCRSISPGARNVNGITRDMVRGKPLYREVAERVRDMVEGSIFVAHNAPFDLKFLWSETLTAGLRFPETPAADTCRIARYNFSYASNSLDYLAGELNLGSTEHRALSDARITYQLLEIWLDKLSEQGIRTAKDLLEAQGGDYQFDVPETPITEELRRALREERAVNIRYRSSKGKETKRAITPEVFRVGGDHIYLTARCHTRSASRTFRLDRIREVLDPDVHHV